jgi:hypothetical protein
MAAVSTMGRLTLLEAAKATHNNEMIRVAEILYKMKPGIQHPIWKEGNDMTSNVEVQRTYLPAGTWRGFNVGVSPDIGRRKQIRDYIGMLEGYIELDKGLVDKMPQPQEYRMDEVVGSMEGIAQTWATNLWYGNVATTPLAWTGLAPRMSALNSTTIQGCGGTGAALTSMYVILWGEDTAFMVYPRGGEGWLLHEDLGRDTKQFSDGSLMEVYRDHFVWEGGLVVKDPLAIGRIANIIPTGSAATWDDDTFISVIAQMRNRAGGGYAYVNRFIWAQVYKAAKDKGNVWYTMEDPWGTGEVPAVLGVPIYIDEMINNSETQIS